MNTWEAVLAFFSVKTTAFTLLGYPMSYVEFVGTLFNVAGVWLATRNRVATWPVGLVGVVLFLALFYQLRLYADVFEQAYYILSGFYGWWMWTRRSGPASESTVPVRYSSLRSAGIAFGITAILSLAAGYLTGQLHTLNPVWFPEEAAYPYVDAATTVASFTATILMAQRRTECWIYWIVIDIVATGLYWVKGVPFVALLYLIFTILAVYGLKNWQSKTSERGLRTK